MGCKRKKLQERLDKVLGENPLKASDEEFKKALSLVEEYLKKPLDSESKGVLEVFGGKKKISEIKRDDLDALGEYVENISIEKGWHKKSNGKGKGAMHILVRHYGENKNGNIDFIDLIEINKIIRSSEPYSSNGKHIYEKEIDGNRYRVVVGTDKDKHSVISFYTNKKKRGMVHDAQSPHNEARPSSNKSIGKGGFISADIFNVPYEKYKNFLDRNVDKGFAWVGENIFERLNEKFDKHNLLTNSKAQKEMHNIVKDYEIESNDIVGRANHLVEQLQKLQKSDSENLVKALNGDIDPYELSDSNREIYKKFRATIDKNAKDLVEAGALKEDYVLDDYVKRFYKEHLDKKSAFAKMFHNKRFVKRKNLTYDERVALGMIEDASFVIPKTIAAQRTQLLKANTLKALADKFAQDEEFEGSVRVSNETNGGGIYRYGALAGKYVRADILRAVDDAQLGGNTMSELARGWFGLVDHIKVNVTVKNPVTHLYNIGSNILLASLNGDLVHLGKVMYMAKAKPKEFQALLDEANKHGLNSSLKDFEGMDAVVENDKPNVVKSLFKNLYMTQDSKLGSGVRKLYDWEDKLFKLASFARHLEDGKSSREAYNLSSEVYVDYSTPLPQAVRLVDKSGISPFLHYVYKSTPATAKVIFKNPIKYLVLQSVLAGVGASTWFNENDDDYKPKWAEDKWNLFGTKEWWDIGGGYYLNAGRMIPAMKFGGLDFSFDTGLGFVGGATNILQGKTPLGYDIAGKYDEDYEKLSKKLLALAENYLPPLTFGRYAQRSIHIGLAEFDVLEPKKNYYDEDMTMGELASRAGGVRKFNSKKELQKKATEANTIRKYKNKKDPKQKLQNEREYREKMLKYKRSARKKSFRIKDKKRGR